MDKGADMAERDLGEYSPEHSKKPLPSEEMFSRARTHQQEIEYAPEYDELNFIAKERCEQLNDYAFSQVLIGERASVTAEKVIVAQSVRQRDGSQRIDARRPGDIERLETITGQFAGYGYLITQVDGGYRCTIGAKILTGYDSTLPFSEGAIIAFCPVGVSNPEFEREQKERRLDDARTRLRRAMAGSPLSIEEIVSTIDEALADQAIENVSLLHTISLQTELLLMQLEQHPDPTAIADGLLELLSVQLELPQKLDIGTNVYRSPIGTSTEWAMYRSSKGIPRYLHGIEAHLIIAHAGQRYGLFLAGMHEERTVQVPLSDIVSVETSLK